MKAASVALAKHPEVFLSVGLSTVRKEIAHQRENALAFGVSENQQREKLVAGQFVQFGN